MAGVKGRSGRRPFSEEMLRHRTILKAWETTSQQLHNTEDPKRFDTASSMVVKDMTSKESIDMKADVTQHDQSILDKYINVDRMGQS